MVKLEINGNEADLPLKDQAIKYVKQIADLFELAVVTSSYTNSFSLPKTPNNTYILDQLGISGDTSTIPYSKVPATLKHHGFDVVTKGWFSVKETTDEYKVSIIDGMIDFFKAIENKTMGVDLDLTPFNHVKNLTSVTASFTNAYYKYIIADYNGKNIATGGGINIDYLVPAFNMGKLLELVMSTFGYTFDNANITEINDSYITYPKAPAENVTEDLIAEFVKGNYVRTPINNGAGQYHVPSENNWTTQSVSEGTVLNNWRWVVPADGGYRFTVAVEAYALYQYRQLAGSYTGEWFMPITSQILRNSSVISSVQTDPYVAVEAEVNLYLNVGDIIEIYDWVSPYSLADRIDLREIHHNSKLFNIYKTNLGAVSLSDAFKDFAIKDFFKEIIWRTATTPIVDPITKHIIFKSINERVDITQAIDWSDKYIRRGKETYINGSYAQKNTFSHKHSNNDDISQQGYLYVNNKNIEAEKVIAASKMYAPEPEMTTFYNQGQTVSIATKKFPIWQREPKENDAGEIEIDYKGLSNRFFVLKLKQSPVSSWTLKSEQIVGSTTVTQFPYADTEGTTFDQIVPDKYEQYNKLLNDFRAHDIEVAISLLDFLELDLTKPYYFEQEGQYYILNKMPYTDGETQVGEFVRINPK